MYVGSPPGSSYSDYAIIPIGTSLRQLQLFFLVFLMYKILTRMRQIHGGESLVVGRLSVTRRDGRDVLGQSRRTVLTVPTDCSDCPDCP